MPTDFKNHRFHILDGMRGVAAITVMVYHYYMHLRPPWPFPNVYFAVDFFFVLSGFVIMYAYGDRLRDGMSYGGFILRRIIRLYPMMATGILLGIPSLILYTDMGQSSFELRGITLGSICNLLFLPYLNTHKIFFASDPVSGTIFPSDGPLWSIFFEMLASIAFIFLWRLPKRALLLVCAVSFFCIAAIGLWQMLEEGSVTMMFDRGWGTENIWGGVPRVVYGFTCGILIYKACDLLLAYKPAWLKLPHVVAQFVLYGLLLAALLFPHYVHGLFYLGFIAIGAPLLVLWGSTVDCVGKPMLLLSEFLGWLSYPVYCLHKPVLMMAKEIEPHFDFRAHLGISSEIAAIITTLMLSIVVTKLIDEPVRHLLTRLISSRTLSARLAGAVRSGNPD